jgi:Carboxypeptidase regulatory-like domain/SPOR domain/Tetratricopeptide repeat/WD40-like Beta Propeller Repeat
MKHILTSAMLAFMIIFANSLNAQNLQKANKEYELFAFNLAIKSYRSVLESDPTNVEALSNMANCFYHLNQIGEAIQWYKKAVLLEGVKPRTVFNLGLALMNQGNYEEAKKWFLIYAQEDPYLGTHYAENCDFAISLQGVPALYRVKKEYLNKSASDFGPAFYGDNVVYASARTDFKRNDNKENANWTGDAKNQMFITSPDENGYLKKPVFLRNDYKNDYNEGPVSYSGDGKWVAYTKNNFVNGTRQIPSSGMELSIYIAEVVAGGDWRDPKPFPFNGSGYSSGCTYLNEDGTKMYFSSNRPDGYGGYDLYVSFKNGKTWSSPKNLGPTINSQGNEITPFVENGALYFASDWHPGLGGFDLFRATQSNGIWNKINHLGNAVNSSYDDCGLVYNSRRNLGYFTSNRIGGAGNEDIYQFSQLADKVVISVKNAADNKPISNASIDFSACGEPVFKTDEKGQYSFQALPGLDCETVVSKVGFNSFTFTLTSDGRKRAQNIEVVLTREADKYIGRIVNATDNSAVEEVVIRATNRETGERVQTVSDESGTYKLALLPNQTYFIHFSKHGFTDTQNMVSTANNGVDKTILGVISFMPSSTHLGSVHIDYDQGIESQKDSAPESLSEESTLQEGFAVQVAASYGDKTIDVGLYKSLEGLGNLYSRPDNGYKKVRIGIFENREEADEARKKIMAKGFSKAFVVKESLDDTEGVEVYSILEEDENISIPDFSEGDQEIKPESSKSDGIEYMVRLAAYKNTNYFDASKVSDLGVIEQRQSGNYTIMFLAGFSTLQEAKKAKEEAFNSGFHGAYVVSNKDGEIKKVNL